MKIEITADKDIPDAHKITSPEWDGVIFRMTHKAFLRWLERHDKDFDTAGAYILYANHFDKRLGKNIYIGQSDDIKRRINQHMANKDYWTMAVIFVSRADWMNIAHAFHIESTFISWATNAHRYSVANGTKGSTCHLGLEDQERVASYLKPVKEILSLANIDLFEKNYDNSFTLENGPVAARVKHKSHVQIVAPATPGKRVRILSGSVMYGLDAKIVQSYGLFGVTYDSENKTHTFSEDVEIDTIGPDNPFPRLFGEGLNRWTDTTGLRLYRAVGI